MSDLGFDAFAQIQHPKKRAYLAALVMAGGNVARACQMAEIDRSTPYTDQWKDDREFQDCLGLAREMAADYLEAEAIRRAYDGVEEPVGWYQGSPGGTVTKYSDTLLIFLLKGTKPEKYREGLDLSLDPQSTALAIRATLNEIEATDGE